MDDEERLWKKLACRARLLGFAGEQARRRSARKGAAAQTLASVALARTIRCDEEARRWAASTEGPTEEARARTFA
jgi:hypothetical protein